MKKKRPVNRDASRGASEEMRSPLPHEKPSSDGSEHPATLHPKRGGAPANAPASPAKTPPRTPVNRPVRRSSSEAPQATPAGTDAGDTRRVPRINRAARPGVESDAARRRGGETPGASNARPQSPRAGAGPSSGSGADIPDFREQGTHVVPDRRTVSDDEYDAFIRATREFDEQVRQGGSPLSTGQVQGQGRAQGRPQRIDSQQRQPQTYRDPRGRRGAYAPSAAPAGGAPRRVSQAQASGAPYPPIDPRVAAQRQSGQDVPRIDLKTGRPLAPGEAPSEHQGGWSFYLYLILEILLVGGTVWLSRLVLVYGIGTLLHKIIFFGGALLIHALLVALLVRGYKRPIPRYIGTFLSVLLVVVVGIGIYYAQVTTDTLDRIHAKLDTEETAGIEELSASKSRYGLSLVVRADQPYHLPNELEGRPVAIPEGDEPEIEAYLESLKKDEGIELETVPVKNYFDGVQAVYDREAEGAIIGSGTLAMMRDDHPNIESEIRVINFYALPKEALENKIVKDPSQQPFNVYISGVDTYDDLSGSARSDVNIIVTIDPYKHEILLTNIPRDSYIPIYDRGNGEYDKLTHAGIYGVRSSIISLEKFLDIDINYYLRVNFNSLIRLVDEFGGVVITNPYEFQTNDGKYYYPKGRIMLDGDKTLWYVRERYNLPEGDLSRGEHQQIVLEALIREALSPEILNNYSNILDVLGDSMETNMPPQHLMQLVTHQLAESPSWDIAMEQVTGIGGQRPSYAAGGQELSVVIPDEASVEACKDKIHAVLGKD